MVIAVMKFSVATAPQRPPPSETGAAHSTTLCPRVPSDDSAGGSRSLCVPTLLYYISVLTSTHWQLAHEHRNAEFIQNTALR